CFFLQAEDGIRDFHVTGVQTCALPISSGIPVLVASCAPGGPAAGPVAPSAAAPLATGPLPHSDGDPAGAAFPGSPVADAPPRPRSEERRVGKGRRPRAVEGG